MCGESVAAAVVARVPRAFVAGRPFLDGPPPGACFTTPIAARFIPVPIIAAGVIPSRIHPAVTTVVVPGIVAARRTAVVEAVLAHAPIVAGVAPATARIFAPAGVAVHVTVIGPGRRAAVVHGAVGAAIGATAVIGAARGGAAGGGALLHHPLLGTGIPAADRALRVLRPLHRRALRPTVLGGGAGRSFLRPTGLLAGAGTLRGTAAPLFRGLDDLGRGPS